MFGALLTILAPLLSFAMGSAFPNPQFTSTTATQKYFTGRCYMVEPNEKLTISENDLMDKDSCRNLIGSYTRVKRGVSIIPGKIHDESDGVRGTCNSKEGGSILRLVGKWGNQQLWWLENNYKGQDIRNFVEVLQEKKTGSDYFLSAQDSGDYVFNIYAKDEILNNLPEHVINCQETGGLVPVVEGESGIRPPQVVPIKNIDYSLYKKNYADAVSKQNKSFPPYKNYLIKIDKQDLPTGALPDGQIGVYTIREKNEMFTYDVIYHLGAFYLRDQIDGVTYVYGTSSDGPPQTIQQSPSLQLGRLWFRMVDSWTSFTPSCKPAVYLYPEKQTDVSVKVNLLGKFTKTDPEYDALAGWNVKAYPDGTIQLSTTNYQPLISLPYLFYEAELANGYKPKEGWIIDRSKLGRQLDAILIQLGLNEKERSDFADYWVPRLISKSYYFAGLVPVEDINQQEALSIHPKPTNIIRIRLIFEGLDYPISATAPNLSHVNRNGFTVVDWGGSIIGETCDGKKIH